MDWSLDKSHPIGRQICEKFCVAITSGELKAGEKLLSVREVALLAGVNPNTVQKSFEELERLGVVYSVRCSGRYVNENTDAAKKEVLTIMKKNTENYLLAMSQLGCSKEETIEYLKSVSEETIGGNHE